MRLRLLKSWTNAQGRKYPIGQILQLSSTLEKSLLANGTAEEYKGVYPPSGKWKMKTNFFKPKEI
jgi:hypothetical protein